MPNFPPKKILVAYDFSQLAKKAWLLGRDLAGALEASAEAVFVYEAPHYAEALSPLPLAPAPARLTDELKRALLDDAARELGAEAAVSVVQGYPADAVLQCARRRAVDLIVMGTHGRTGAGRVLFGSVAESLSRHSPIPLLTVRRDWRPIRSILVPLNFADYSLAGFHAGAELAERLGARMDVLFVPDGPYSETLLRKTFEELVRLLPAYFAEKSPRFLRGLGNAAERIILVGADYDLIALVAHRKSMFRDVILGTTAERVLRHCETPVLAVPDSVGAALIGRRREAAGAAG